MCIKRAEEAGISRDALDTIARDRFGCSSLYTTISWKNNVPDLTKLKGIVFKVIPSIAEKNDNGGEN